MASLARDDPDADQSPFSPLAVVALVAISGLGQLSITLSLPALPAIAASFGNTIDQTKMVLTAFLACMSVSMLGWGPAADHFGRRPTLLAGLLLYLVATLSCAVSTTLTGLVLGRCLEGVAAGAGLVLSRAIARDRYHGPALAKTVAYVNLGQAITPAVGPTIGGYLLVVTGSWRATFAASLLSGLLVLMIAAWKMVETRPSVHVGSRRPSAIANYRVVLTSTWFVGSALAGSLALAIWYAFLAASPALLIERFHAGVLTYGLSTAFILAIYMIGNYLTGRLSSRFSPIRLAGFGSNIVVIATVLLLVASFAGRSVPATGDATNYLSLALLIGPMIFVALGMAMTFSACATAAMSEFPEQAGTASAGLAAITLASAALGSWLVSLVDSQSVLGLAGMIAGLAGLSALCLRSTCTLR